MTVSLNLAYLAVAAQLVGGAISWCLAWRYDRKTIWGAVVGLAGVLPVLVWDAMIGSWVCTALSAGVALVHLHTLANRGRA